MSEEGGKIGPVERYINRRLHPKLIDIHSKVRVKKRFGSRTGGVVIRVKDQHWVLVRWPDGRSWLYYISQLESED